MKIRANGIDIEVEDTGVDGSQAGRPVVLLIMGLGMQLVAWPMTFVQALVDAGFRVIRHDNRDIGLTQHMDGLGTPNVLWESLKLKLGFRVRAPYTVGDMAADAVGVLDALGIGKAHIVGVSMGGMIAQRVAIAAPQKVLSLTSIMSSSGARGLPEPKPHVVRALLSRPAGKSRDDVITHFMKVLRVIGSPGFPIGDDLLRERIAMGIDRNFHPAGTLRQLVAIGADTPGRAAELARITVPTLVIHGKADVLVPFGCGEDTARRIAGAKLVAIEGMGHDLAPGVVDGILPPLIEHMRQHS
ncbi:MAG: alpha/beta fold hydrolase [Comamonadaceae bacterium]|nr:MAG: alpha/beta fold hydrolase [Comamonadaceae bacterium]